MLDAASLTILVCAYIWPSALHLSRHTTQHSPKRLSPPGLLAPDQGALLQAATALWSEAMAFLVCRERALRV